MMTAALAPRTAPAAVPGAIALPVPAAADARCGLLGEHAAMQEVYRRMARAAPTLAPVLIIGEPGTGREAIAHCIHLRSPVAEGPWVAIRCGELDGDALDRALFGADPDPVGGQATPEPGGFEQADGGTIFLDDIAGLAPALQARLLRAVQDKEIERVGSGEIVPIRARIVASSTRDLHRDASAGRFRDDLYFRLAIVTIQVPRLADRGDDLLLLVAGFARHFLRRAHATRAVTHLERAAYDALRAYAWPENVRELRRVVEQAVLVAAGETIALADLPRALTSGPPDPPPRDPPRTPSRTPVAPAPRDSGPARARGSRIPTLAEVEARHIAFVLAETHGVIHTAAELLGIHRNTLTRKIREYGL